MKITRRNSGVSPFRHILMVTGLFGGVQAVNVVASLIRNKCAALFLGPDGVGALSLLNTLVNMLVQLCGMGVSLSGVRRLSLAFDEGNVQRIRSVRSVRLLTISGGSLGLVVCGLMGHWLLSPAVLLMVVCSGELAILKAARRLRWLALSQIVSVLSSLLLSVPIYIYNGASSIVAVVVLTALAALLPVLFCSLRVCPLQFPKGNTLFPLSEMRSMFRLGMAFTLAAVIGAASEYGIRVWLQGEASSQVVGWFSSAQLLTAGYMAILFSALEQDYMPRLSATSDHCAASGIVRRQLLVLTGLTIPLVLIVMVLLPWLVPLLLSSSFLPIVPLARWWAGAMILKSATLPVAYLTLARGRSLDYLLLEAVYYVFFVISVIVGWHYSGLSGVGVGIFIAHVFDLLLIHIYARYQFDFRL